MAKRPTFYPNLPREKRSKSGPRVGAVSGINISRPLYCPHVARADRLHKPSGSYNPTYISENSMVGAGTVDKFGTRNPGWKVTIAKGGDAGSNYSGRHDKLVSPTTYSIRTESLNWLSVGYGTMFGGILLLENDTTSLNNQAIGRLRNKLQGKVGNAQLAAPIAESREIHRLVRQINNLGMDTLKAMLAAKQSKGKSIAKLAGDIWLGYGFGVNPLLKDIQSAADSILHYVTRQNNRIRVSGAATQEYQSGSVPTNGQFSIAQDAQIAWYRSAHHLQGIRYTAGIDLEVRGGSNYSVPDHLGLKLGALPSTLWELTAFSWVVDYVSTVGSFLDDTFYTVPGNVKYVCKSYKYQSEVTCTPKCFTTLDSTSVFSGTPTKWLHTGFTRTTLAPSLPVRSLSLKSVDEIASNGIGKMLNLASVLAGRRGPKL